MKRELSERVLVSLVKDRPAEGRLEVSDTKRLGLRFRVSNTGRASWLYEKRVKGGRKRRHTLGTYPAIGLSEARSIALEIEAEAAKGIDRIAIAEADKKQRSEEKASQKSVREVLETYDELHLSNLRRGTERKRQLEQALEEHLSKDVKNLLRGDMQAAIDAKAQEGKLVFANRIKAALSAFSRWAWSRGYTEIDQGARLLKAAKEVARERCPSVAEIQAIYTASFDLGGLWGPVFRLLILTGQRRSEILSLSWNQIDLQAATITKPGSETKNGKPHVTHLSHPALHELISMERRTGLVFTTTETTPVSGVTKAKRRLDKMLGDDFEHWRTHDLRTGMASAMAASGVPEGVVDRILNHAATGSAPSAVARVYNQADMLPQRAAALDRWAEMVTGERDKSHRNRGYKVIAPDGYVTVSELAFTACNGLENYDDLLHQQLLRKHLVVLSTENSLVSLDQRILGRIDGRYVNIDPSCWRIAPLVLFVNGFLPNGPELIETSRVSSDAGSPLSDFEQSILCEKCVSDMRGHEKADNLVKSTSGAQVKALTPFAGKWICISDEQAKEVAAQVATWRNENLMPIDDALETCKQFFVLHGGLENEPATNRDQILIRELEHAISLITGNWLERSFVHIHKALQSGDLVAETLEGQVVPPASWPIEAGHQGGLWTESVPRSNAVRGFNGKLLFVPRALVRSWLSHTFQNAEVSAVDLPSTSTGNLKNKPKPTARADAVRQFQHWVGQFEETEKPVQSEREAWRKECGISREVYRSIENDHAPKHWSMPGAPKRSK